MFSKGIATTALALLARAFLMMIMVVVSGLAFERQLMQPVGKSSSTALAKSRGLSRNRMPPMSLAPSCLIDPPPPEKTSLDPTKSVVTFPGGGLFFWWQAGFIRQRQKQGLLFADAYLVGASAGALSAVLAKCNVDMDFAFERALQLCDDKEVWTRPVGLLGTWGSIVRQWLDDLLPEDAADLCRGNVFVLVTVVEDISAFRHGRPILSRRRISDFADRQELIDCCMASVHIPFFMDGRAFNAEFRGLCLVDGSFLPSPEDLTVMNRLQGHSSEAQPGAHQPLDHTVDHKVDASLSDQAFVQLKPSAELVRELMTRGGAFAAAAHPHSSTGGRTTEVKGE